MELIIASYVLTFVLAIATLCTSIWALIRYIGERSDHKDFPCKCSQCKTKKANMMSTSGHKFTNTIHAIGLALFVITAVYTASLYIGRTTINDEFNPYAVLNVTRTSSIRKITMAYNRLSKSHRAIVSKEDVEKAFQLLDQDTNHCLYSFGSVRGLRLAIFRVFIPCEFFKIISILIENPLSIALLTLMALMTIILIVSSRKLRLMSREALVRTSSGVYRKYTTRNEHSTEDILAVLSASRELEPLIKQDLGDDSEYRKLVKTLSRKPYTIINEDWIHRSNSLLYFHISRLHENMSDRITKSSNLISSQVPKAIENYCLHSRSLIHTLKALKISQCVSQATWSDRPLLQLPHFTEEMADKCSAEYGVFDPIDILKLGKAAGNELLRGLGLTPEQIRDIMHVENNVFTIVPSVTYDLANPVNCSSEVTLKIEVFPTKVGMDVEVSNPDFRYEPYFDDDEIKARKMSCCETSSKKVRKHVKNVSEYKVDKFPSSKFLSHTPYVMDQRYEKWWFVLGDKESNTLFAVEQGELPQTPDGEPLRIKTRFIAPAGPGIYNFTLYVICDSYIGRDIKLSVPVTVDTISSGAYDDVDNDSDDEDKDDDSDDSDEDEDEDDNDDDSDSEEDATSLDDCD